MDIKKIIHAGRLGPDTYIFLIDEVGLFQWKDRKGRELNASGDTYPMAIRAAWKLKGFSQLQCGYRYTLPERDEVGTVALFHQMIASYSHPNGVYFDMELGHMAKVDFASQEALKLWKGLQQ